MYTKKMYKTNDRAMGDAYDDDIIYTYEELFAEWSKPEQADIREEYEDDFTQWLYDCVHGNGALREV